MHMPNRRFLMAIALTSGGVACAFTAGSRLSAHSAGVSKEIIKQVADDAFPISDTDKTLPKKRLYRLTRDQIDATVAALFSKGSGATRVSLLPPGFHAQVGAKASMPRDPLQTNYEYAEDLSFSRANLGKLRDSIARVASFVRENPTLAVDCTAKQNADECLKKQGREFVVRAFRADIDEASDKTAISNFTDYFAVRVAATKDVKAATGDFVQAVLNSPRFLYRKEWNVDAASGQLVPAQALQALTYALADQPPEALDVKAINTKSIDALLKSEAAREKLVRFLMAWLEIKTPGEFTIDRGLFPNFNPEFEAAIVENARAFLEANVMGDTVDLKRITQTPPSLQRALRAHLYERRPEEKNAIPQAALQKTAVKVAAVGKIIPPQPVSFDEEPRFGIFSHPAVIASHSGPVDTRPIKRGVFWVRKVMCTEMDPQPTDVSTQIYDMPGKTERERIEQGTANAPCANCHKKINPFAFFQGNYDAIGRWQTTQKEKDERGVEVPRPIDVRMVLKYLDYDKAIEATGPAEALEKITTSMTFQQCFVRQLFRFYMGRSEEPSDHPLLRDMFVAFAEDGRQDILKPLRVLAASDRIVRRQ